MKTIPTTAEVIAAAQLRASSAWARLTAPEEYEMKQTTPHTMNIAMPRTLRVSIEEARSLTGETAVGFIRAAIVDRLLKLRGLIKSSS